jgi:Carboxypeptidase regulatory-like domain
VKAILLAIVAVAVCRAAGISGKVADTHGAVLPGTDVQIQSESTGARWKSETDPNGGYSVSPLPGGRYKVTVRAPGFRTVSHVGAVLDPGQELRIDFTMELLELHEVITVSSGADPMNPAAGSSLLVTRQTAGATLPANGGDYRVLFDLMPGVVATPASTSDAGQFTSNGQRPNSNLFRVDGVSANTGVGSSILPGAFPGASLPAMTAIGSTENLVSNETAESVELRTFDLAPEFSERPGAEALVHTRSGSNTFHEEAFGHLRESDWNARDWFANSRDLPYFQRPSYRRFGAALGGRIRRDRTFYFLSVEESSLFDSGVQLTSVPSLATRQNAQDKLKPILNSYPYPTGPDLSNGTAESVLLPSSAGQLLSASLRIDQTLGSKGNLFLRVAEAPSRSDITRYNWASGTAGMTLRAFGGIHDFRFNYSRSELLSSWYGGGPAFVVLAVAGLLPNYTVLPDGAVEVQAAPINLTSAWAPSVYHQTAIGLSIPGLGQFLSYGYGEATQNQWELRDTFARTAGRHEFRIGGDYVHLAPSRYPPTYAVLGVASSLDALLANQPLAVNGSIPAERGGAVHQGSFFVQDTFHVSDRLSLLYGLNWAFTPPSATDLAVPSVSGLWTGTAWQNLYYGNLNETGPWAMRYGQIAPRFGAAYRLPAAGLLRAGVGKFYDTSLGAIVNPINGAPFNSWMLAASANGTEGLNGSSGMSPPGEASADVQAFLSHRYPGLRLPASYQWRISLESELGRRGLGSLAYVGSSGSHLPGHQAYLDPATGALERLVTLTANSSNYEALEARYNGTLLPNLFAPLSYTWSHSIDNGSQDSSVFLIHPGYRLNEARASSSFDVRQAFAAAVQYRIPPSGHPGRLPDWLRGWYISGTLRARTGFPIDVLTNNQPLGQGFDNMGRPDRVPGAPLWIADDSVAGHKRLNPAAFRVPAAGLTGSLGRNSITGNGLAQFDGSLRRDVPLPFNISAEIGISFFNVFNHPAFADPVPFLASPWFGQSTSMQNLMLGTGSPNTGLPPLFQTGGARSAEFSFRVSF